VRNIASLSAVLFLFWLGLSGYFTPLLLGFGVASAIVIVIIVRRAGVADGEGHPVHLLPNALWYLPWLVWQILLSGLAVARLALSRDSALSPTLVKVRASQRSALARSVFANSITLTPGTVSIEVDEKSILVHALTEQGAEELAGGGMDAMVCRLEGRRP